MKRTTRDHFRVQVTGTLHPQRLGDFGGIKMSDSFVSSDIAGDYQRRCEEMVKVLAKAYPDLKAEVVCDSREECTHCGCEWEVWTAEDAARWPEDESSVVGEPVCCEEAQTEFYAAKAVQA
jgi:hypothetical protein